MLGAKAVYTTADSRRHLDRLAVVEQCHDGSDAMQSYRSLHRRYPQRELYFVHTSREELDIEERQWLGCINDYSQPSREWCLLMD